MITATCQHTGLTFEARSKAARNHPAIAELLTAANKRGAYAAAVEAICEAREELGESITVEAVEVYVSAAIDGRREEQQAQRELWSARRQERRDRVNALAYGGTREIHEIEDVTGIPLDAHGEY